MFLVFYTNALTYFIYLPFALGSVGKVAGGARAGAETGRGPPGGDGATTEQRAPSQPVCHKGKHGRSVAGVSSRPGGVARPPERVAGGAPEDVAVAGGRGGRVPVEPWRAGAIQPGGAGGASVR